MLKKYFTDEEYERIKKSNELIYKSLEIVTHLFNEKCDKGGFPYVIHLLKVYSMPSIRRFVVKAKWIKPIETILAVLK